MGRTLSRDKPEPELPSRARLCQRCGRGSRRSPGAVKAASSCVSSRRCGQAPHPHRVRLHALWLGNLPKVPGFPSKSQSQSSERSACDTRREGALGIPTAFMDHPQGLQPLREGALNQLQAWAPDSLL
ncbi:hypothetical protein E5288_WYG012153 [Bos mutus]|uniref:Uncharacterized protein n=1 Tax=Bos mutus TaxID=72004 RepID=A0A6B0R2Q4_9CETA|nr:hypothetical protein [Bos mutus]